jgi:hypothetical protein
MTRLIASGTFETHLVDFVVDTGSNDSQLWPPFSNRFPQTMKLADAHGAKIERGMNSARTLRFAELPKLIFEIGDSTLTLQPAKVNLDVTEDASTLRDGAFGMDILSRFSSVSFDFSAMLLELGKPVAGGKPNIDTGGEFSG